MQRIARVYVNNFGFDTAWYQEQLFDLRDPQTGEPTDAVFNLENGGGKTSLLSFIFSCFDPPMQRWLQHLQDRNHRFVDYFAKDGRMALLAMEWYMPPRATGERLYKLVIGQAVSRREIPDRSHDADREFFAFTADAALSFDALPAPGLGTPVRTLGEFRQWVIAQRKVSADLFATESQQKWTDHLRQRLVDLDLLRMQVDFNSNEGGMAEGFLTFDSELDFLGKLLQLTLDQDRAHAVRESVALTADKLRSKPRFQRRLDQLGRLKDALAPFCKAASDLEQAQHLRTQTLATANGLQQAVDAFLQDANAALSSATRDKEVQGDLAQLLMKESRTRDGEAKRLDAMRLERQAAAAKKTHDETSRELAAEREQARRIEAADLAGRIDACASRIDQLEALKIEQEEILDPKRQHVETQGSLLDALLRAATDAALQRKQAFQAQEREYRDRAAKARQDTDACQSSLVTLSREQSGLEAFEKEYVRQRARLTEIGALNADETQCAQAIARWSSEHKRLLQRREELASQRTQLTAQSKQDRDRAKECREKAHSAQATQLRHKTLLGEGTALQDELRHHPGLRVAMDTDAADPDSGVALASVEAAGSALRKAIAIQNVRIAEVDNDRGSIVETHVAGRSPDVDAVVQALQNGSIRSARAANTYIAELVPDAAKARALVTSDPDRFLGVTVAAGEWEDVLVKAASLRPTWSRPVVVSVASLEPAPESATRTLVLPPRDDAAFNRDAARDLLSRLDLRKHTLQGELQGKTQQLEDVQDGRTKLLTYRDRYGRERIQEWQRQRNLAEVEEASARATAEQHERRANDALAQAEQLVQQAETLAQRASKAERSIQMLQDFQRDYEDEFGAKATRLAEVREALSDLNGRLEHLKEEAEALSLKEREAATFVHEQGAEARMLESERERIEFLDASYPAESELQRVPRSLDALRRTYAEALTLYKTTESAQLALIDVQLKSARAELGALEGQYRPFKDIPRDEFATLIGQDLALLRRQQNATISTAEANERRAHVAVASAQAEERAYAKQVPQATWGPRTPEMDALSDQEMEVALQQAKDACKSAEAKAHEARAAANAAHERERRETERISRLKSAQAALSGAFGPSDDGASTTVDEQALNELVQSLLRADREQRERVESCMRTSRGAFDRFKLVAQDKEFAEVEPEVSRDIAASDFEILLEDRERIRDLVQERIRANQDHIDGMTADFELCVGELYDLARQSASLLDRAARKVMPPSAPYVAGKAILRLKSSALTLSKEDRQKALRHYLNGIIDTGAVPVSGAQLAAEALLRISGRSELGLLVLRMEQNDAYQYQPVGDLKGSKGQGSVIAMFLYLLINQLRADMQARNKSGGGPLILDNPFAKVQTRALLDAQRLLAKEIGVQLIFFTAQADYNILAGFRRIIRLRKAGVNRRTNRSHIETVSVVMNDVAAVA